MEKPLSTKYRLFVLLLCIGIFTSYASIYSQKGQIEDLNAKLEVQISLYLNQVKEKSPIHIGKDQVLPPPKARGGMYLQPKGHKNVDQWGKIIYEPTMPNVNSYAEGELKYNGVYYPLVQLRLDLVEDILVILAIDNTHSLILDERLVDYALFNGYKVVYLKNKEAMPNGYYLQLYDGTDNQVYERISSTYLKQSALYTNYSRSFYVNHENKTHQIKSKNGLLKLYKTYKKELDKHIKDNKLRFKDNFEDDIVSVVNQYEKLTKI